MDTLLLDIRYAIRILLKNPGFTAIAVLILALGIGANTAIFSMVDAVLFRPLPVSKPDQLVRFFASNEKGEDLSNTSYPVYANYRDQAQAFSGVAAYSDWVALHLSVDAQKAERITGALVTGNYFDLLGIQAPIGRLLNMGDDRIEGGHPVAVISDRLWKTHFGADPAAIGKSIRLNHHPFTIVGVAPAYFYGVGLDSTPELWLPISMWKQALPEFANADALHERQFGWLDLVGRLKPEISIAQAQAQLNTIAKRRAAGQAADEKDPWAKLVPAAKAAVDAYGTEGTSRISWLLLGMVSLVLLASCADVAGLLLVRSERNQREIAIRLAVGGSRSRIIRQLLVQSLVLSLLGAASGLLLAAWISDILASAQLSAFPIPLGVATGVLNGRVLVFSIGLALVSGAAFGLVPAMRASDMNLVPALKSDGSSKTFFSHRFSLSNLFVAMQLAISAVLLIGAGLLLRTLWNASGIKPGFEVKNGFVASLDLSRQGLNKETGAPFYEEILQRVKTTPGVRSAAFAFCAPLENMMMRSTFRVEGYVPKPGEMVRAELNIVSPGYFQTMGTPLLRGRDLSSQDTDGAENVAVINRAMAERYWPGKDPIGKQVYFRGEGRNLHVVGVVADMKYHNQKETAEPLMYIPQAQMYMPEMTLIVRTAGNPAPVIGSVSVAIAALDNDLPLFRVRTLEEMARRSLGQERVIAGLLCVFGLLALALAAAGVYGVLSYSVERRSREFGIRMALGAQQSALFRMVLQQVSVLVIAGLLIGLSISAIGSRLISSILFGVQPNDPITFLAASLILMLVSLAASHFPARRVTKVDPVIALRYE